MPAAPPHDDPDRRTWTGDRGSLEFHRLRRGVGRITFTGRLTDDAASVWTDHFQWLVGDSGPIVLFLDGGLITLASGGFVSAGTSAVWGVRSRLSHGEVLVEGTLVEIIAKTANLTLGGIMLIGRDRAAFEGRFQRAV